LFTYTILYGRIVALTGQKLQPQIDGMAASLLTPTLLRSSTLSTAGGKEGKK